MMQSLPPESVFRTVLANGLTLLVREDHSAPVAAVVTYVKAGYFDEDDDVAGISHVLEHMFFKGTPSRGVGAIAKQTKASGGYLNAATIYDHTSYYAVLPTAGFDTGLAIQADAYANSLIDGEELRRELEVIIEEAKRKEDNPGAIVTETLYELLHDRHRIRRWRIGREAGLRTLTREKLLYFYRTYYRPSNTVLAIAGDVDMERLLPRIEALYGALPNGEVQRSHGEQERVPSGRRFRERTGDIAQTQLAFGWRTPGTRHEDTPRLDLAASVLAAGRASRLYRAVRERRLASSVSAFNYTPTELGVFMVHAEGAPESSRSAAEAMWGEIRALREQGVRPGDLERAQRLFESRWLRRLDTMEGQANFLAEWEALGDWRLADEYSARMLGATATEVTDAMRRHLRPEDAALMVYRPSASEAFAVSADEAFGRLDAASDPAVPVVALPKSAVSAALHDAPAAESVHGAVSVFRTTNGVPILVRRKAGSPIVHFGVYARGGASLEDPAKAGVTSLMARTSLKGTTTRSAEVIALETELLGGSISPTVTSDGIGWTLSVPAPRFAAAIDLLADVVLSPTLPPAAFETERGVALLQLLHLRDDMFRYPVRLASEAAFGSHPYGRSVLGSEETLAGISVDDARTWHASSVQCANTVIAVVGDVEPADTAARLARAFGALLWREPHVVAPPSWPARFTQRTEARDKSQTALAVAFPGPRRDDPARVSAHLLASVASGLGGRFFDELRDKQSLAYTVHVYSNDRASAGMFLSYIATSPEKEEAARAGLLREFARLRDDDVTDEEILRATTYALGTHAISQQGGGNVLNELVDAWLYGTGLQELDQFEARIRAVTPDTMRALALEYFDPDRRVEGVVRGRIGG